MRTFKEKMKEKKRREDERRKRGRWSDYRKDEENTCIVNDGVKDKKLQERMRKIIRWIDDEKK